MKNFFKARLAPVIGIIALVAVFGFSMAACGDTDADSSNGKNKDSNKSDNEDNNSSGGTLVGTTVTDNNIDTKYLSGVVFDGSKFVANVNFQWSTSTDGITWTVPTGTSIYPTAIAYGNGTYLAGGICNGGNEMWRSSDGLNWTNIASSVPFGCDADVYTIAYGNGTFVVGGTNDSNVVYSTDGGVTWKAVSQAVLGTLSSSVLGYGKRAVSAIAYGDGKFVAGGNYNIAYSTDGGVTWTNSETSALGLDKYFSIDSITYGGGKFIAGGSVALGENRGRMAYSYDGITWTAITDHPFPNSVDAIAYGNGKFVAGGYTGKMATSTDGITWTALPDSTFGKAELFCMVEAIAYGNGKFVAVGYIDSSMTGKMVLLK